MPLLPTVHPAATEAAFSAGLPTFLSGPNGLVNPTYAGKSPEIPTAVEIGTGFLEVQPIFVLSLTDAANNTGVISPFPAGWRFFAGGAPGAADKWVLGRVVQRGPSQAWKLIALAYGPLVLQELGELTALVSFPEVQQANYASRFLEVPGLNFAGFWLAGQKAGSTDYIVPTPNGSSQIIAALRTSQVYAMPDFLAAIRPLAARNLTIAAGHGA
jgi:hypothetical protein